MDVIATTNKQAMKGWTSKYYPYSMYKISQGNVVLEGDNRDMDPTLLLRGVISDRIFGDSQAGGGLKELVKFSLNAKDKKGGFKQLEEKANKYFRKNNLDVENKTFILTLKDLDDKKTFIKKYKKKI